MAYPLKTGSVYSVLLYFPQQEDQHEIISPSRGPSKFTTGNFMLVFGKKEINQMIKNKNDGVRKRFFSHHPVQLSPLTDEGMENRDTDLQ